MDTRPTADALLRALFGRPRPARNDCGFAGRFEYEDTSRMFGWGPEEGEGPCDYPEYCPYLREHRECRFFTLAGLHGDIVCRRHE